MVTDERDALESMVNQFAYYSEGNLHTGGLSALEDAFEVLGWSDPYPAPWRVCDVEGCKKEYTCGWPSPNGYRKTCFDHWER